MADLYHPELGVTITVPWRAAWVRLRNGWEYVAEPVAEESRADEPVADEPEAAEESPQYSEPAPHYEVDHEEEDQWHE